MRDSAIQTDPLPAVWALEEAGARAHASELAGDAHAQALDILNRLTVHEAARAELREIVDFLLQRQF